MEFHFSYRHLVSICPPDRNKRPHDLTYFLFYEHTIDVLGSLRVFFLRHGGHQAGADFLAALMGALVDPHAPDSSPWYPEGSPEAEEVDAQYAFQAGLLTPRFGVSFAQLGLRDFTCEFQRQVRLFGSVDQEAS